MSDGIDKSKCARLVVEAVILSNSMTDKYGLATCHGIPDGRIYRVYKKTSQKFERRCATYNAIVATPGVQDNEIYVGGCDKDTPPGNLLYITMDNGDTIYFDNLEFESRQP